MRLHAEIVITDGNKPIKGWQWAITIIAKSLIAFIAWTLILSATRAAFGW